MPTIPPTRSVGDAGHVGDHNNMSADLTTLFADIAALLVATNNLSDIGSPAMALANLGGSPLAADWSASAQRQGYYAQTMPGWAAVNSGSNSLTTGVPYLNQVTVERSMSSGTRTVDIWRSAAATCTAAAVAVLNSSGTIIGSVSADQSTAWNSGTLGLTSCTVGTFGGNPSDTLYVVLLTETGTNGPKLQRSVSSGPHNANLSGSGLIWSTNGSGQTTITNRTLSSNAAQAEAFWVALR